MNSDLQKEDLRQGIAEVRGSLDLTASGAIKNSIRYCLTVFMKDPLLQGAVSYNLLTERVDIVKTLWWKKQTVALPGFLSDGILADETWGRYVGTGMAGV